MECSAILPGQQVATVAAHRLPEPSELSQREASTNQNGHPVVRLDSKTQSSPGAVERLCAEAAGAGQDAAGGRAHRGLLHLLPGMLH